MVRVVAPVEESSEARLFRTMADYLTCKNEADLLAKRQKELRDDVLELFAPMAKNSDGHIVVRFPKDRQVGPYVGLTQQRRVSRKLNTAELDAFQQAHPEVKITKTVEVVDEDLIMQALTEGLVSDADLDRLYPVVVTKALVAVKK